MTLGKYWVLVNIKLGMVSFIGFVCVLLRPCKVLELHLSPLILLGEAHLFYKTKPHRCKHVKKTIGFHLLHKGMDTCWLCPRCRHGRMCIESLTPNSPKMVFVLSTTRPKTSWGYVFMIPLNLSSIADM